MKDVGYMLGWSPEVLYMGGGFVNKRVYHWNYLRDHIMEIMLMTIAMLSLELTYIIVEKNNVIWYYVDGDIHEKKVNKKLLLCLMIDFIVLILLFPLIVGLIKKNIVIHQTEIEFYNDNKDKLNKAVSEIYKKNSDEDIKIDGVQRVYYDRDNDTYYIDFGLPTQLFDLFSTYRGIVYSENNTPYIFGTKENELNKQNEDTWVYSKNGNTGFVQRIDNKWFIYSIDF